MKCAAARRPTRCYVPQCRRCNGPAALTDDGRLQSVPVSNRTSARLCCCLFAGDKADIIRTLYLRFCRSDCITGFQDGKIKAIFAEMRPYNTGAGVKWICKKIIKFQNAVFSVFG